MLNEVETSKLGPTATPVLNTAQDDDAISQLAQNRRNQRSRERRIPNQRVCTEIA
jgi:hypothetical protein